MSQPHASTDNHHAAGRYEIRLQGHLATRWAACRVIVDDDHSARSILVETLKGEGHYLERLVRACQQRTSSG